MNKKLLFILIFLVGPLSASAQEIPEEFYTSSQLYDNNASNAELTLSVDKFIYSPGDSANVLGFVHDSSIGARVFIQIIDPIGNVRSEINVSVSREGIFKIQNDIPDNLKPGDYTISARYGTNGIPVFLKVTIHVESIETFVTIPSGSHVSDRGVTYNPKRVIVEAGLPLVWINDDESVHTIVSGKVGFNNKMFSDGKFDSGTFGPGNTFTISLPEGDYDYFCKLHPWLAGFISVTPSTDPNYVEPKLQPADPVKVESTLNDEYVILNPDKELYFKDQEITLSGSVMFRESDLPISIQVFDPAGNLVTINQITPDPQRHFVFSIPLSGNSFNKNGLYTIIAQYGVEMHRTEISFIIDTPKFEAFYQGFNIYEAGGDFYALPLTEGSIENKLDMNLLNNPSFDEFTVGSTEIHGWANPSAAFSWSFDNVIKVSGSHSIKISTNVITPSTWSGMAGNEIPVKQGDVYLIETNMKQKNAVQSHINVIGKFLKDENFEWKILTQNPGGHDGTFNWKNFVTNVEIPEGIQALSLALNAGWVQDSSNGEGITWFDNFKIKQIMTDENPNLMKGNSLDDLKNKIDASPPIGPLFVEEYDGSKIMMYGGIFYVAPEEGQTFDLSILGDETDHSVIKADSIEKIKQFLDAPSYPVSEEILLEIWNERPDLQTLYPQVAEGDFYYFKGWALIDGWKEDPRLSVLVPPGTIPDYMKETFESEQPIDDIAPKPTTKDIKLDENMIPLFQIIVIVVAITILGFFIYRWFPFNKSKIRSDEQAI